MRAKKWTIEKTLCRAFKDLINIKSIGLSKIDRKVNKNDAVVPGICKQNSWKWTGSNFTAEMKINREIQNKYFEMPAKKSWVSRQWLIPLCKTK